MLDRPPVPVLRIGGQVLIDLLDIVPGALASGHDDRDETADDGPRVGDLDLELVGHVRQHVGRRVGNAPGRGRTHVAVILPGRLGDEIGLEGLVPVGVLAADPGRPHRLEDGKEAADDGQRLRGVDVEEDDRPGLVDRRDEVRPDGEGLIDVGQGRHRGRDRR